MPVPDPPTANLSESVVDSPMVAAAVLGVAEQEHRAELQEQMHRAGLGRQLVLWEAEPYAAVTSLSRVAAGRIGLVVLSMRALVNGEVAVVGTLKRMRPPVRVVLADTDENPALSAHAVHLGADAVLTTAGLHRPAALSQGGFAFSLPASTENREADPDATLPGPQPGGPMVPPQGSILSPDELRALLHDP